MCGRFPVDTFLEGNQAHRDRDTQLWTSNIRQSGQHGEDATTLTMMLMNVTPVIPPLNPLISANAIGNAKNSRSEMTESIPVYHPSLKIPTQKTVYE
jgi:hypothetical protein